MGRSLALSVTIMLLVVLTGTPLVQAANHGVGGPNQEYIGARLRVLYHTVQPGETLSQIAARYGIDLGTIMSANGLSNPHYLTIGQRLMILPVKGMLYRVVEGDSLWQIARRFNMDMAEVVKVNRIVNPNVLRAGQVLILPGGSSAAAKFNGVQQQVYNTRWLLWPLRGRISSRFGPRWGRFHAGIDIAAQAGAPIRAAQAGRVLTAGWLGGYGKTVVIQHDNGWKTLYGHASKLLVRKGQRVETGQMIARVGSTGVATGPHLHFEVIVGDRPTDPLALLANR